MADSLASSAARQRHSSDSVWASLTNELLALRPLPATSLVRPVPEVELAPAVGLRADGAPWVIIGAGPSAQALLHQLARLAPTRELVLINGEAFVPYNRAQISSSIADGRPLYSLAAPLAERHGARLACMHGVRAIGIDRTRRVVQLDNGQSVHYGKLVLATGARPLRVPPLTQRHSRVRDFRSLQDLQTMASLQPRHVLIVGGGLLGIEAARAAQSYCERVTLVERFPHILPRQLDAEAARRVTEHLQALGIDIRAGRQIATLRTEPDIVTLELDDGTTLSADLLISATGVQPEMGLAAAAGLAVDRGVIVDADFRTTDEHIYALGECCQQNGHTFASLAPCLSHAESLAAVLAGVPAPARPTADVFQLKLSDRTIVSIGNTRAIDSTVYSFSGPNRQYRRLFVEAQRTIGAVVYDHAGVDISVFSAVVAAGLLMSEAELQQFSETGRLPAQTLPSDAQIICFCANVSAGKLLALQQSGSSSVEIIQCTGASSHCGSCTPRVEHLLGARPSHYNQWTTWLAIAVAALLLLAVLAGLQMPTATRWSSAYRTIDVLWRSGVARQLTGYVLLAVAVLSFAWGYWRRRRRRQQQPQVTQLGSHSLLASAAVVLWFLHTGGRTGSGLNRWLLLTLVAIALTGALAGITWLQSPRSNWARQLANSLRAVHWFALLPVPSLLIFHVLKTYYF